MGNERNRTIDGQYRQAKQCIYQIKNKIDKNTVLATNLNTNETEILPIKSLVFTSVESVTNNNCLASNHRKAIVIGRHVTFHQEVYQVIQSVTHNTVIGINDKTNESTLLPINAIFPLDNETINANGYIYRDLEKISDPRWEKMERRLSAIRPLLSGISRNEIVEYSEKINVHYTTLYRWLKKYQDKGIAGLVAKESGNSKGAIRISKDQEEIIQRVIRLHHSDNKQIFPHEIIKMVEAELRRYKLALVSDSTVRVRISKVSTHEATSHLQAETPQNFPVKSKVNAEKAHDLWGKSIKPFDNEGEY